MKRYDAVPKVFNALVILCGISAMALVFSGCASRSSYNDTPTELAQWQGRPELARNGQSEMTGAEELWIIGRSYTTHANGGEDTNAPGTGELVFTDAASARKIPLPLKHTEVRAAVSGGIATIEVKQEFANPYDRKIEAVYVFPLPHDAAVNEFIMTIGRRRIRGIIRERAEAEQIYLRAKNQGYVASLLTEERPNIFQESVANIEPGMEIGVHIKYFETLAYDDGWYEFVFPMVVGPRYHPPGVTNGIGAVERGNTGASGQQVEVEYLRPEERSGHDIALRVDVDAGVKIEEFQCVTHHILQEQAEGKHLAVTLAEDDRIPNKDFVLRYRVAGERINPDLLTHRDERGGYFALMLYPPKELTELARAPVEMVFVLDCSGSMSGAPITQAKAAIGRALDRLLPEDTFQIITFSDRAAQLARRPLAATPENIRKARDYVMELNGDGPTEMIEGIRAALDLPHEPGRMRFVCILTDGCVCNEAEITGMAHERLGNTRIFSFGVGAESGRYLLDELARMGAGAAAYLGLHDDVAKVMDDFFARISHPAMTDVKVDWGGMQVEEVQPSSLPDLFVGRPVMVTGRFAGSGETALRITGRADGRELTMRLPVKLDTEAAAGRALPAIWAREKIAGLAERMSYERNDELPRAIRQVALDYSLTSPFTAFIAVDASGRTAGSEGLSVKVPVPAPEGVNYDKTIKRKDEK